jgi:hypothetical protein
MWSKESFYTSRISRNSLDSEMLMGGWDTLYINEKKEKETAGKFSSKPEKVVNLM